MVNLLKTNSKFNSFNSNKLNLILNDVQENYEVFIKDIYGAVLYREYFHKSEISNEFDLNLLAEGNYYVEIVNQSTINRIPFIVNSNSTLINKTVFYKLLKNTEFGTLSLKIA